MLSTLLRRSISSSLRVRASRPSSSHLLNVAAASSRASTRSITTTSTIAATSPNQPPRSGYLARRSPSLPTICHHHRAAFSTTTATPPPPPPPSDASDTKPSFLSSIAADLKFYWQACKDVVNNYQQARTIRARARDGHAPSSREVLLMRQSQSDVRRLVPTVLFFGLVPFSSALLPVVVVFFPQLLPTGFITRAQKIKKAHTVGAAYAVRLRDAMFRGEHSEGLLRDDIAYYPAQLVATLSAQLSEQVPDFASISGFSSLSREVLEDLCKHFHLMAWGSDDRLIQRLNRNISLLRATDIHLAKIDDLSDDEVLDACVKRSLLWRDSNGHLLPPSKQRYLLREWFSLSLTQRISPALLAAFPALNLASPVVGVPSLIDIQASSSSDTASP